MNRWNHREWRARILGVAVTTSVLALGVPAAITASATAVWGTAGGTPTYASTGTPSITVTPSTGLSATSTTQVTISSTNWPTNSGSYDGALSLECNTDSNQPTYTVAGAVLPVGCTPVSSSLVSNVGTPPASMGYSQSIVTGTMDTTDTTLTDSAGHPVPTDSATYPCPPTPAQVAAGDICTIAAIALNGLSPVAIAVQPLVFSGQALPTLSLSPASATPGAMVTLSGANWPTTTTAQITASAQLCGIGGVPATCQAVTISSPIAITAGNLSGAITLPPAVTSCTGCTLNFVGTETVTNDNLPAQVNATITVPLAVCATVTSCPGYWMLSQNGTVYGFGTALSLGSAAALGTAVAMASTPDGLGYWVASPGGAVVNFGDAGRINPTSAANSAVVTIAATHDGKGYWLATTKGQVIPAGDAKGFGDASALTLSKGIVDMVPTPDSGGYWLLGGDGGVFAFGDAGFFGSTGNMVLNQPAVAMVPTSDGAGYWFVASDGGVFAFGDAGFFGSSGIINPAMPAGGSNAFVPNKPVNGMLATSDGKGYWMVAADGGVFAFGDAGFVGSLGANPPTSPIVGFTTV